MVCQLREIFRRDLPPPMPHSCQSLRQNGQSCLCFYYFVFLFFFHVVCSHVYFFSLFCLLVCSVQDYTSYPFNSDEGGADYYLSKSDCVTCITSLDCTPPPRLTSSPYVDRVDGRSIRSSSLYGNRAGQNTFLDPKKIMIAGQTTREKPFGD